MHYASYLHFRQDRFLIVKIILDPQPTEWEKIFANEATDKGLISKIYKQLMQLNIKKKKQPNQKMGRRSKQTFHQTRHTDGQKAHEKMLNITNYQRNADQNYNEVSPYTEIGRAHV